MAKRLTEQFPIGKQVEIYFPQVDRWFEGQVVAHAHPAIWVQTADGRPWFVTNGRRVRHFSTVGSEEHKHA